MNHDLLTIIICILWICTNFWCEGKYPFFITLVWYGMVSLYHNETWIVSIAFPVLNVLNHYKIIIIVKCDWHFPAPSRNYMTPCQALYGFPSSIKVSLHKNNKINMPILQDVLKTLSVFKHSVPFKYVEIASWRGTLWIKFQHDYSGRKHVQENETMLHCACVCLCACVPAWNWREANDGQHHHN